LFIYNEKNEYKNAISINAKLMMSGKQFYHETANLFRRFSAFQKSGVSCNTAFSFCLSFSIAYWALKLPWCLLSNMNKRLQAFCYQASNSGLSDALNESAVTSRKKWGLIIYDFTRENWLTPAAKSLFLFPLSLLTVRGKFNLSST